MKRNSLAGSGLFHNPMEAPQSLNGREWNGRASFFQNQKTPST